MSKRTILAMLAGGLLVLGIVAATVSAGSAAAGQPPYPTPYPEPPGFPLTLFRPDLIVSQVFFGNPQSVFVTIENQGSAGTGAGSTVCVLNSWTGENLTKPSAPLAAGASETQVFVLPDHWEGLSMVVTADCTSAVAESNEANNQTVVGLDF